MKVVLATHTLDIPDNVKLEIKGKQICVTGPRGELKRNFRHQNLDFYQIEGGKKLKVDAWFGYRKTTAASRIAINHVNKLIARVTEANTDEDRTPLSQVEDATMTEIRKPDVDCPSLEDITTSEIEAQWFEALFEEDCDRVIKLLKNHPRLLRVGWEEDPLREVEGCPVDHWSTRERRPWMGRTALHVGAIKGCTELIKQVLEMCELDISPVLSRLNGRRGGTTATTEYAPAQVTKVTPCLSDGELKREGADTNDKSLATGSSQDSIAGSEDEQQPLPESAEVAYRSTSSGHGNLGMRSEEAGSTIGPSNCSVDDKKQKMTKRVDQDHWKSPVKDGKSNGKFRLMEGSLHGSEGIFNSGKPEIREFDENPNSGTIYGDSFSNEGYVMKLLSSRDGEYNQLSALDIASFHGDTDASALLHYATLVQLQYDQPDILDKISPFSGGDRAERALLRKATAEVIGSFSENSAFSRCCLDEYSKHRDFNFLPREEYFFHFMFANKVGIWEERLYKRVRKALWKKVRSFQHKLWQFLLELKDGQVRPPCHIAITGPLPFSSFISILQDGGDDVPEVITCALTTCDGAGRTPFFTACATGSPAISYIMLEICEKDHRSSKIWATCYSACSYRELLQDEIRNFCRSIEMLDDSLCTPLQAAALHKYSHLVIEPIEKMKLWRGPELMLEETLCQCRLGDIVGGKAPGQSWWSAEFSGERPGGKPLLRKINVELDSLQLAVLVGDKPSVECLLQAGYLPTSQQFSERHEFRTEIPPFERDVTEVIVKVVRHPWQAFHIAAASGSYEWLKMFIDNPHCNPFVEDYFQGNSALHHAMQVDTFQFSPDAMLNYLNCISCRHFCLTVSKRTNKDKNKELLKNDMIQIQGGINLLLQAGCDVFKTNKAKQIPYPLGRLRNNVEFLSWWYERQAKEFNVVQNGLIGAANAIAATGTLVATASYMGPLQPPLGYVPYPTDQIQYENGWVATFVFCDTLSFYLAIVAIIFSLVPSLPMPQQAMMDELRRTRTMVTLAVGVLFPSIISVLIAFASSSMAVVSASLTSSIGGKLTIATVSISGPLLLLAFFVFFTRLLANVFPRHAWVRCMYQLTYF